MYEWMSHLKKGYTPEIIEILTCSLPVFPNHNSDSVYACGTNWRLGVVWTVISSWDPKENYSVQIIVNPGRSHLVAHLAEFNIHVKTRLLLNSECLQTATPYRIFPNKDHARCWVFCALTHQLMCSEQTSQAPVQWESSFSFHIHVQEEPNIKKWNRERRRSGFFSTGVQMVQFIVPFKFFH